MTAAVQNALDHLGHAVTELVAEANRVKPQDTELFDLLVEACVCIVRLQDELRKP